MEKTVCVQKVGKTIARSIGKQQEKLPEENGRVSVTLVRGQEEYVAGIVAIARNTWQQG